MTSAVKCHHTNRGIAALRSSPRLQGVLLVVVAAFAAVSLAMGGRNALRDGTGGEDLAPVYKASRLWLRGANPYQPSSDQQWKALTGSRTSPPIFVPVAYTTPYTPIALLDIAVAAAFEWQGARVVWLVVNLFLAAAIPVIIRRLWYPEWTRLELALFGSFWLSGLALRVGLGLGQHHLVVLAALLLGLLCSRSRPAASGVFFALTLHKFTWPGVFVPMLLARRSYRVVVAMVAATGVFLAGFFLRVRVPMAEVVRSYAAELGWWFDHSEALGGPGDGPFHFFPVLLALLPGRTLARVAMYGLVVAGAVIQFGLSRRRGNPEDLTVAGFVLLALWSTYHGLYDGVFLIVPLCVLLRYAATAMPTTRRRLCEAAAVLMIGMWLVDPLKVGLLVYHVPVEQAPVDTVAVRIAALSYRTIPFLSFWLLAVILWSEKPVASAR